MVRLIRFAVLVVAVPAVAQTVTVGGTDGVKVKKANGETVTVGGSSAVQVKTKKGTTTVKTGGTQVNVDTTGAGVAAGADSPAAPARKDVPAVGGEWTVADNDQTLEHTCVEGERIGVLGNENTITLHGPCQVLVVSGNENKVVADVVGSISALGNENTVQWRGALKGTKPRVSSAGNDNTISQLR